MTGAVGNDRRTLALDKASRDAPRSRARSAKERGWQIKYLRENCRLVSLRKHGSGVSNLLGRSLAKSETPSLSNGLPNLTGRMYPLAHKRFSCNWQTFRGELQDWSHHAAVAVESTPFRLKRLRDVQPACRIQDTEGILYRDGRLTWRRGADRTRLTVSRSQKNWGRRVAGPNS
jgi:hypothetical protein